MGHRLAALWALLVTSAMRPSGGRSRTTAWFTKVDGTSLKPAWLDRRFQRLARQAGLPAGVRV